MPILVVFLYALTVVVSLLLIGIILIQPSKSGGMGAAFGGVGESVFGGKAGSHLTKATVVMTAIFFVIALLLAALIGHGVKLEEQNDGVTRELTAQTAAAKPAVPEKAPAAAAPAKAPEKAPAAAPAKNPAKTPEKAPAKK